MPILLMIIKTLGTKAIADLVVYLMELLCQKTDNTIDDKCVETVEKLIAIHIKK